MSQYFRQFSFTKIALSVTIWNGAGGKDEDEGEREEEVGLSEEDVGREDDEGVSEDEVGSSEEDVPPREDEVVPKEEEEGVGEDGNVGNSEDDEYVSVVPLDDEISSTG